MFKTKSLTYAFAVILSSYSIVLAQKDSNITPAVATFYNSQSDGTVNNIRGDGLLPNGAVSSDGTSVYEHEVGGVECRFFSCETCSQDWTGLLRFSRPRRTLTFDFNSKIEGSGPGPTGILVDDAFSNVRTIYRMPVNATEFHNCAFSTDEGSVKFIGKDGSGRVLVHRVSATEWLVTASPNLIDPSSGTASDLAVLYQTFKNVSTPVGLYRMPMQLTIRCKNADCAQ